MLLTVFGFSSAVRVSFFFFSVKLFCDKFRPRHDGLSTLITLQSALFLSPASEPAVLGLFSCIELSARCSEGPLLWSKSTVQIDDLFP